MTRKEKNVRLVGALYTKSCACSKGSFADKFVRDPNKTTDLSQRPPQDCLKCGNPVDGLYCRYCAPLRKKLRKANHLQSGPREHSSQSPPQIDHHCCYGCGDPLDGIFCRRCTCENGAHIGYNCPPKVLDISNPKPCHNQNIDELPQTLTSFHPTCYSGDENSFAHDSTPNFVNDSLTFSTHLCNPRQKRIEEEQAANARYWKTPACCDDDDGYDSAITPVLSTEETDNSLSMGGEHLDIISATESDEVIKSSVEVLVPIPSESKGIPDNTSIGGPNNQLVHPNRGRQANQFSRLAKVEFLEFQGNNEIYKTAIIQRFGSVFEDPMVALKNAKYEKNAKEYQNVFDTLLCRVDISQEHAVSLYLGGLPT
nr:gypsy/Ty3 retroelement polyprotein [Tanacetum cinerariifolium]